MAILSNSWRKLFRVSVDEAIKHYLLGFLLTTSSPNWEDIEDHEDTDYQHKTSFNTFLSSPPTMKQWVLCHPSTALCLSSGVWHLARETLSQLWWKGSAPVDVECLITLRIASNVARFHIIQYLTGLCLPMYFQSKQ